MPTSERYSRYREDQTTIWVSKSAADFLAREKGAPGEGAAAVLDRVLNEYKKMRRSSGGGAAAPAAKSASKGAAKTASKAGTRGTRSAAKGAKTAKKAGRRA